MGQGPSPRHAMPRRLGMRVPSTRTRAGGGGGPLGEEGPGVCRTTADLHPGRTRGRAVPALPPASPWGGRGTPEAPACPRGAQRVPAAGLAAGGFCPPPCCLRGGSHRCPRGWGEGLCSPPPRCPRGSTTPGRGPGSSPAPCPTAGRGRGPGPTAGSDAFATNPRMLDAVSVAYFWELGDLGRSSSLWNGSKRPASLLG